MVFNTCNGRCELQKSLKKYTDNEKRMQNNLKDKAEVVYIQASFLNNFKLVTPIESKTVLFASYDGKPISVSNATFHPPSYFI